MTPGLNLTFTNLSAEQHSKLLKAWYALTNAPQKTVSPDEDEDFGTKPLRAKDLEDEEEDEAPKKKKAKRAVVDDESEEDDADVEEDQDEEDAEDDDSDGDDDEPGISFKDVRAAVNKLGEKKPETVRSILKGFGIDTPKELSATRNAKHYEGVYRKVMAAIKAGKKKK